MRLTDILCSPTSRLKAESHLLAIPNGTPMQTSEYELRRIFLPRTPVNSAITGSRFSRSSLHS